MILAILSILSTLNDEIDWTYPRPIFSSIDTTSAQQLGTELLAFTRCPYLFLTRVYGFSVVISHITLKCQAETKPASVLAIIGKERKLNRSGSEKTSASHFNTSFPVDVFIMCLMGNYMGVITELQDQSPTPLIPQVCSKALQTFAD